MVKTSSIHEPKRKKAAEEEDMIERSKNMDKKILEKRKNEDYEEMLRQKELIERKREDEIKSELENKRRKHEKEKDKKKRENEKQSSLPSNVKELPTCVKSLYPDSLQFCVPGDGACCLNCVAAWILLDVARGPQLARDLNTHLAEYRPYYINKLSFPLTITIAGGERIVYDEGEENDFFDMLVTSPEACFMWRGSADVIGLTNFTNMKIEIAIYNQDTNTVEEIQKYEPDLKFPWKSEDANAPRNNNYPDMKLLNYKNTHFDLIVQKGHPLLGHVPVESPAQDAEKSKGAGAVEVQEKEVRRDNIQVTEPGKTNFPCAYCDKKFSVDNTCYEHIKSEHKEKYICLLENKLKESESQVCKLSEEVEKIKIENKELKTIRKSRNPATKEFLGDNYDEEDEIELDSERELLQSKQRGFRRAGPQVQSHPVFSCHVCGFQFTDQSNLDTHLKKHNDSTKVCNKCGKSFKNEVDLDFHKIYEHSEISQWNCMQCSFQANSKDLLKTHINFKHTKDTAKEVLDCDKCKRQFRSTWHLRNHTRDDHGKEEECNFYKDNRCKFGNTCWKLHSEQVGPKTFMCYSCKETFININELMTHRKKKHIEMVKPCDPKQGTCRFEKEPEKCWFKHTNFLQATKRTVPP